MHTYLSALTLAALVCGTASAQTVIIPAAVADGVTEGNSSDSFPWGRDSTTATSNDIRIQVSYDSSEFTGLAAVGPITITGLRFRADDATTTTTGNGGNYGQVDVRLGAMGVAYDAMSTTFAANWPGGVEPAPAYSGPVTVTPWSGNGTGVPGDWYISITLANPVVYDPTSGADFMIDIASDGTWTGTSSDGYASDYNNVSGGSLTNRVYNSTTWTATTGSGPFTSGGLVTELTFTPPTGIFANFTADKSVAGPGEPVQFTDTTYSSSGITSWAWDFDGDMATDSTLQNPTWLFTGCGPQNVTLTVTDASGSDTITKTNVVDVQAPASSFLVDVDNALIPFVANFTDTSTNNPTAWDWDFTGDGVTDATTQNPSWAFGTAGLYVVTLTASNPCGQGTTASTSVIAVSGPPTYSQGWIDSFGTGCPAASPMTLSVADVPVDNGTLTFSLSNVPTPASSGVVMLGSGALMAPLDSIGATDCTLLVEPFFSIPLMLANTGTESLVISPLDGTPSLAGTFFAQGGVVASGVNPLGVALSNRVSFEVSSDISAVNPATAVGLVAEFTGNDTFAPSGGSFFNFYNNSMTGETIQTIIVSFADGGPAVAGITEFDVNGLTASTYGSFEAGNSTSVDPVGCTTMNTYAGTDVTTGLVYANTDPASCGSALGATTGWVGSNFDGTNPETVRFDFTSFGVGDVFRFDADTDGGPTGADGLNEALVLIVTDQRTVAAQLVFDPASVTERALQVW